MGPPVEWGLSKYLYHGDDRLVLYAMSEVRACGFRSMWEKLSKGRKAVTGMPAMLGPAGGTLLHGH